MLDPFDKRGLLVYIATAIELNLKSELYYLGMVIESYFAIFKFGVSFVHAAVFKLGHELTTTAPKLGISWYAVGSYYFCCKKYDLAQKYLHKSTRMDKRYFEVIITRQSIEMMYFSFGCMEHDSGF